MQENVKFFRPFLSSVLCMHFIVHLHHFSPLKSTFLQMFPIYHKSHKEKNKRMMIYKLFNGNYVQHSAADQLQLKMDFPVNLVALDLIKKIQQTNLQNETHLFPRTSILLKKHILLPLNCHTLHKTHSKIFKFTRNQKSLQDFGRQDVVANNNEKKKCEKKNMNKASQKIHKSCKIQKKKAGKYKKNKNRKTTLKQREIRIQRKLVEIKGRGSVTVVGYCAAYAATLKTNESI